MLSITLLVIVLIVNENTIDSKGKLACAKLMRKISLSFGHSSLLPHTS